MEIADLSSESIIIYDPQGEVTYCNPASEALYGWQRTAILGRNLATPVHVAHVPHTIWQQLLSNGQWMGPIRRRSLTGAEFLAAVRLQVRYDQLGSPVDVVEYSNESVAEVSDTVEILHLRGGRGAEARLRKVENDFSQAARLSTLGELTASIAHEIKQPMSAILTNAQTCLRYLLRPVPDVEKATLLTRRIIENSQRANEIIGRIREMAQKRPPASEPLNLNDIVRDCLIFLRHETDAVDIDVFLDESLPLISGDRVQLQQVMVNLVINSLQAMTEEPRNISLSTRSHEQDGVIFSITDSGPGIPECDADKLFEGFFTTKDDGIGIGLALSQTIVKAHGGDITARNAEGSGAIFSFSIPVGEGLVVRSAEPATADRVVIPRIKPSFGLPGSPRGLQ